MFKLYPENIDYHRCVAYDIQGTKRRVLVVRKIAVLGLILITIQGVSLDLINVVALYYFSNWGFMASTITFIMLLLAAIRPENGHGNTVPTCKASHNQDWFDKAAYSMYQLAWTAQCMITGVFWFFYLFDNEIYASVTTTESKQMYHILVHTFPCVMLFIDMSVNSIYFHFPQIIFSIVFAIVYAIVAIALAYTADIVPYPGITWRNTVSLLFTIEMCLFLLNIFIAGYFFSHHKKKKLIASFNIELLDISSPTSTD